MSENWLAFWLGVFLIAALFVGAWADGGWA